MTTIAVQPEDVAPDRDDRVFLGHPRGLAYLAFTEAWERFSYYGMQTLLVLYMVKHLLLPGQAEQVVGLAQLQAAFGGLSGQALSSAIFGLYTSSVYLTPILGGLLADRVLGRTTAVTLGALLMALGHFLMAFEQSFLLALLSLVLGVGLFKGNIASQVGALYKPGDLRRADAFQIFFLAINAGVIAAPLVAGTLGERVGWHWGFGAAGVGMLIGLLIYLAGRRHMPPDPVLSRGPAAEARPKLGRREGAAVAVLLALLPVLAVAAVGNQQIFNAYLVWAERSADFRLFGREIPTTWLITLDTIASVSCLAGAVWFWRAWAKRLPEPDEVTKITLGCLISVTGFLALAAGAFIAQSSGSPVALGWLVTFHILNSIGFANIFPVGLALYSRAAPAAIAATIIGIYYLHLFAANSLVGWIGTLLERMPAVQFWLIHAGCSLAAGLVFLMVRRAAGQVLAPQS